MAPAVRLPTSKARPLSSLTLTPGICRPIVANTRLLTAPAPNVKPDPALPAANPQFPPPKTDKPRPHVCGTCGRSFARLEHLKRHERSHTKEKPFECPQCTRCFARRDLLLRHQQKLHQAGAASTRPRNGRRESTTGLPANGMGRVRKNSIASNATNIAGVGAAYSRPRANTISHIDGAALNHLLEASHAPSARTPGPTTGHSHHPSLAGFGNPSGYHFPDMSGSLGQLGNHHGLPKLDTHLGMDIGGGMRTAPIPGFNDFDFDKLFSSASTINPAQLHFSGSLGTPTSPFQTFPGYDDDSFDWMTGLDNSLNLNAGPNEQVLDESSPSAISTASQSGFSDVMLDGSNQAPHTNGGAWHNQLEAASMMNQSSIPMEAMGAVFPELMQSMNTVSPKDLQDHHNAPDFYFSTPPPLNAMSPSAGIPGMPNQYFQPPMTFNSDSTSIASSSVNGSARQSSVTSISTDSITDATRQTLLMSLSQATSYKPMQRKYSQPAISSPLSPNLSATQSAQASSLPSTSDLQRFVNAYIQYFHPHLPFLHIPTLSFDSPIYASTSRAATFGHGGSIGGGECLILAMAAIGALYEFEHAAGKELFEAAKKMILFYLEERRRADLAAAVNGLNPIHDSSSHTTPLWLVQSMLLNLIYGHQCGDKQANDVAYTHCAALVSLAKAANLDQPYEDLDHSMRRNMDGDVEMRDDGMQFDMWSNQSNSDEHSVWIKWKTQEERKRTLYAVFVLSSLTVTAYNHAPRILNSELHLDLPCEEDLWAADSAQSWVAMGGPQISLQKQTHFADALSHLLTASERQRASSLNAYGQSPRQDDSTESALKPSTFGCYVLINALHVYIWETRQRHNGRQWTSAETEQLHNQIEPALKAWQAAWRANPHHSLERPNPYGPLPADSIPLLDLAYVRLFVSLARSKEGFWQRDFDAMAEELARGDEIIQHAETDSESSNSASVSSSDTPDFKPAGGSPGKNASASMSTKSSKRERHLRKAAFYAADSLAMSDKLGVTFAEFTSRELPIQSAMCTFDCAQVLAEWVATVQERVGRYMGILGQAEIDFTQVPAIMLLEDEDIKLLQKIADILHHAEMKINYESNSMGSPGALGLSSQATYGYGSKLLMVTAYMMKRSAVWPVTHVMARALEAHANHVHQRAETSVIQ
ncbi:DNA binding regulatory protein-like protein AmdX [Saccharata proteae CBS 121410]|uniref:DNA binding regulatory protein-like protein AmdX n=1 Tax=Saccharata proteae CBS 121410 TaxID=1314787 RepID=A0A9P4HVV0_9PEZI|nr:DNA binding regulatory protein-like protein AmdX [Saccharata proteae CBS 121410]